MKSKLFSYLLITGLFIACSNSGHDEDTKGKPIEIKEFSSQDATQAIEAFNSQFYNKDLKLYYTNSDKEGVAAIWTQAIYWDMIMNAYKRTKDEKYKLLIEDIYQGGYNKYDKYNWNNTTEWFIYDDMMWWIISLARAYEITKEDKYLNHSKTGFSRVWEGAYDPVKGGMFWAFDHGGKTACINYPTVIGAMTLYNITKEKEYLDKAKEIYTWSRDILFDKNDGKVADHKYKEEPTNWTTQLYNQATCIGSAVMLYKETKEKQYLDDAILATEYTKNVMCDNNGILPYKTGIEQGIYTAIFAQYIIRLIEDGNQTQYIDWMRKNINKGWANKNSKNLTYKNFNVTCPSGTIEVYDASACPALMQVIPPKTN